MPYSVVMDGGKHCVVKKSDGKKMGCHDSHGEAESQVKALYANESMTAGLMWVDPFAYKNGEPFRIFPIGQFKRGDRTIDLNETRLREMESNYNAGRPRWKIPIYFGHPTDAQPDPPKGGNVTKLEFRADGLFAHPEYTEKGKQAVESGEYQYVSPGVLWSLAGALYTDENGQEFDNTVDHIALTNRPFLPNTAIFSSDSGIVKQTDTLSYLTDWITEKFDDLKSYISKSPRDDDPDDDEDDEDKSGNKEKETMADKQVVDEYDAKAEVEKLSTALKTQQDEFATKLKTQQDAFEAEKKRADEFAIKLAGEQKTRRLSELRAQAETFVALPVKSDEYAEKFYALEQVSPDLAKWFGERFAQFNTDLAAGNLFSQVSRTDAQKSDVENIETLAAKIHAEEFKSDPKQYGNALIEAGKRRPDLMPAELREVRGSRRGD